MSVLFAPGASAHHSFAVFDSSVTKMVSGTVKDFQWSNPHVWITLVVQNTKGGSEVWSFEASSPGILRRFGWGADVLRPGDKITLNTHPRKDERPGGSVVSVVFADGRELTAADESTLKVPGFEP